MDIILVDENWKILNEVPELVGKRVIESQYGKGLVSSLREDEITLIFQRMPKIVTLPFPSCLVNIKIEDVEVKLAEPEKETEQKSLTCYDCIEYVSDNCPGNGMCEDFRPVPRILDEERSLWPTDCDVSFRRKTGKWRY